MTGPMAPPPRSVCCPICLDTYPWSTDGPFYEYDQDDGGFTEVDLTFVTGQKRDSMLGTAYVRCPNPSRDMDDHFLPALYATFNKPLVIGLVGATETGKTHLLATMIGAIEGGGLQPYGLNAKPLDFVQHMAFRRNQVERLLVGRELLGGTVENTVTYADALLVTSATGAWPVTFFDVAGGDLVQIGKPSRFVAGATALLFVVDPDRAVAAEQERTELTDQAFANVLGQLGAGSQYLDAPAAVVIGKADRYRFHAPVDTWLHLPGSRTLDAERMHAESRDAYAFLYEHNAHAWLRPFHECRRCTLHFATATGGNAVDGKYPRGVRPRRVLEPLIALLAMSGVISGPEAAKVGVW